MEPAGGQTYLDEANGLGSLSEALTADVDAVLAARGVSTRIARGKRDEPDETSRVGADSARERVSNWSSIASSCPVQSFPPFRVRSGPPTPRIGPGQRFPWSSGSISYLPVHFSAPLLPPTLPHILPQRKGKYLPRTGSLAVLSGSREPDSLVSHAASVSSTQRTAGGARTWSGERGGHFPQKHLQPANPHVNPVSVIRVEVGRLPASGYVRWVAGRASVPCTACGSGSQRRWRNRSSSLTTGC